LEPLKQLLNPDEVAHFKSVYSAYIQCVVDATTGACRAWIGRPAFLDAGRPAHLTYMPIEIKVADAVVTFRLLPGEKDESEAARHELHNGTQIEFGDLTYRFVTLSEASLPVTVGTGDQQGAAVNGAAPVVEVYGPEKDASGNG
jgi:hypothetical protein